METRYQRSVRIAAEKERHSKIIKDLQLPTVEAWEIVMEEFQPQCAKAGIPSRWTDWDEDPENAEDYEGEMPSRRDARLLCEGCPLVESKLCERYAVATGQTHGVWGGRLRSKGRWVYDER